MVLVDAAGSALAWVAPGLCVRMLNGWTVAEVGQEWIEVGSARPEGGGPIDRAGLSDFEVEQYLAGFEDEPHVAVPDRVRATMVPVGEPVVVAPEVGERRASRFYESADPDPGYGPTDTICGAVSVRAGAPGADGMVEVAVEVETVDGGWETGDVWVEPRVPADALTLLSLRPMPIDEPLSVRVDAVDGEVEWWGLNIRGC
ncbi:MAG: hypothetical protein JJU45_07455 [Acidimicrobiia bacterium]|nr:hypothetical protein [Acidimicrobiia bacterium]